MNAAPVAAFTGEPADASATRRGHLGHASVANTTFNRRIRGVGAVGKLVLLTLVAHCRCPATSCWVTVATLVEATDESHRSVTRALATLKRMGLVEVLRRGGTGRANTYRLPTLTWERAASGEMVGNLGLKPSQTCQCGMSNSAQTCHIGMSKPFQACQCGMSKPPDMPHWHATNVPIAQTATHVGTSPRRNARASSPTAQLGMGDQPATIVSSAKPTPGRRRSPPWLDERAGRLVVALRDEGHPGVLPALVDELWALGAAGQDRFLAIVDQAERDALTTPGVRRPAAWFVQHLRGLVREEQVYPGGRPPLPAHGPPWASGRPSQLDAIDQAAARIRGGAM